MFGIIWRNPSPTLARDKANIECISGGKPSSYELAFGVELGSNPHSKRNDNSNKFGNNRSRILLGSLGS